MRGEHSISFLIRNAPRGSSPHARGAQARLRAGQFAQGIIPACAGSTPPLTSCSVRRTDHPRMRGEHVLGGRCECVAGGSSPHARGAQTRGVNKKGSPRIIPACAGSTLYTVTSPGDATDHPRMRGEHQRSNWPVVKLAGSSPHARGAQPLNLPHSAHRRIIPACAGSTVSPILWIVSAWDHPRMRGEHSAATLSQSGHWGSSPHARGALSVGVGEGAGFGIIPACAGSTSLILSLGRRLSDHPRMRGEHDNRRLEIAPRAGSSPHARGARRVVKQDVSCIRIIPACAGSTFEIFQRLIHLKDHPRMRGEHTDGGNMRASRTGSSPHARGAPIDERYIEETLRIIPACAGSTSSSSQG